MNAKSFFGSWWTHKERPEIIEVRHWFFDQILYPFLAFGLIAAVMGSAQAYQQGRWVYTLLYSGTYLLFVATALPRSRIPLVIRSLGLVLTLFVISVSVLARIGLSGIGLELLLLACGISSALLGRKVGLMVVGMGGMAMVFIGAAMVGGLLPIHEEDMLTSLSPLAWATSLTVFSMAGVGLVILPQMFLTRLKGSLTLLETRAQDLEQANRSLTETITAREEAEKALRENEERLRILFDQAADTIFVSRPDGRLMQVNQQACRSTGYSQNELLGMNIVDIDANHTSREKVAQVLETLQPGRPRTIESLHRRKDGSTFPVEITIALLQTPAGPLIMGIARDITERKDSEAQLKRSEHRFRQLFNTINDFVYTQDLEGRFLSVNPALCNAFGYTEGELLGRPASDFMKPQFGNAFKEEYLAQLKEFGHHQGTSVYFTKNGEKLYIEYRSSMVHPEHGPPHISGVGRGVTEKILSERKMEKLRRQITQAQKLESVGTLAGGIAHNFNNVLMGIQGRASLMMTDKDSTHPDYEHLKGIEQYVQTASELTKDLLGFARGGKYEVAPVNLNDLIKHENRLFGHTKKEIRIRGVYEKHLWTVEVDQGQMSQALLNIYVNAWQAMPGGGNLYIKTENVHLNEEDVRPFSIHSGKYVKVSVTDTGVGMDPATQERIFDPFFTTKDTGSGTGLGLASVYGIIKNHGGFIDVHSEPGQGTTFAIYLPASEKKVREEIKPSGKALRGSETVLLVDDEEMIIDVAKALLQRLGYQVFASRTGKEAVELYERNKDRIDVVILDMVMPDMSGGETYDRLKKMNPHVKVLLSSGYSINGEATEILNRGCDGFIQKPFKMEALSQKIRAVLGKA
ncbi:MAG: PAS domain S-box protein [Deltaproteobacteria bacterium]|nr:PAS domain S-box protein [Deltaproteobacteria bacterium]